MPKRLNFCASVLLLLLTCASILVQTQPNPKIVKAEPRDLPLNFYRRMSRPNASLAPRAFKQRLTNKAAQVFNLGRKLNAPPIAASIAQAPAAGNLSWTQWSKDPQHTGFIDLVGQGFEPSAVMRLLRRRAQMT